MKSKEMWFIPTTMPTTFIYWQNSAEKSQAHNLKVVGSNPTPATNLFNKINDLYHPQRLRFLGFFCVLSLIRVSPCQPSYQPVIRFIPFFLNETIPISTLSNHH